MPSIDVDELEKIAHDHEITDKREWGGFDLHARLGLGHSILLQGPSGPGWACGVHTTVVEPSLKGVHYAFDFRDEKGEELLPFFTEDEPLISMAAPYTNLNEMFPELTRVHTAKVGMYDNNSQNRIARQPFDQKFDTFWLRYSNGFLRKLPEQSPPERCLVDELCILIHKKTRNKLEKRMRSLEKELTKLRTQIAPLPNLELIY